MATFNIPKTGNTKFDSEMQYFANLFQAAIVQSEKTGNYDSVYRLIDQTYSHLTTSHVDENFKFTLNTVTNKDTSEEKALAIKDLAANIQNYIPDVGGFLKQLGATNIPLLVNKIKTYISNYNDLVDDSGRFAVGEQAHINVFANDINLTKMNVSTLKLIDPNTHQLAATNTIVVKGEGTWTVDTAHPGVVVFTPETGFKHSPTPIQYVIDNQAGTNQVAKPLAPATITINYNLPDEAAGAIGQPITQHVTANDTGTVAATAIKLLDPTTHLPVDKVIVAEGTWSIGPNTGDVTFTPAAGSTNSPQPISYVTLDKYGHAILDSATQVSAHYPTIMNSQPVVSLTGLTDVNEGVGWVEYTLTLDKVSTTDTQVSLKLTDGKATLGLDYYALIDGNKVISNNLSYTIPAGQKTITVYMPVIDDTVYEGNESYTLSIDKVENGIANLAKSQVTTIIHDDATGSTDGRDPNNPANHENDDLNAPMSDIWINYPGRVPPATHDNNHAPVAHDDFGTMYVPNTIVGTNSMEATDGVLHNQGRQGDYIYTVADTDSDGDELYISGIRTGSEQGTGIVGTVGNELQGIYGTLIINPNGDFTYEPKGDAYASLSEGEPAQDIFTYTVSDGHGGTDTAQLTIEVIGGYDMPMLSNDDYTVAQNKTIVLDPLANDIVIDKNNPLKITGIDGQSIQSGVAQSINVAHGVVNVAADGTITFTAEKGYSGTTSFSYTVNDNGYSPYPLEAQENITILGSNNTPTAKDDSASIVGSGSNGWNIGTYENQGVLNNYKSGSTHYVVNSAQDTDKDGDALSVIGIRTGTKNGTGMNGELNQDLIGTYGKLMMSSDGQYSYSGDFQKIASLAQDEIGQDVFTYTISDGHGGTDTAQLTINITGVNDAPIATDIPTLSVTKGTSIVLDPMKNVVDPDGDKVILTQINYHDLTPGTAQSITTSEGIINVAVDGTITFTPNASAKENSLEFLNFTVSDGKGATSTFNESIRIDKNTDITDSSVNHSPVANSDTAEFSLDFHKIEVNAQNGVLNDAVIGNFDTYNISNYSQADTDIDGDKLTVTGIRTGFENEKGVEGTVGTALQGYYGKLLISPDGSYSYDTTDNQSAIELKDGQYASDSFTYTVSDGKGGTATASLAISLYGINDKPIANDDNYTVAQGHSVILDPLANDVDPEREALTLFSINGEDLLPHVEATINVNHGIVNVSKDGVITFTPEAGFTGTTSFSYKIHDQDNFSGAGYNNFATATETIHVTNGVTTSIVNKVNDASANIENEQASNSHTADYALYSNLENHTLHINPEISNVI